MLRFLHEASEVDGPSAFTEPVLEALWQVIPADQGACGNVFSEPAADVAPEARTLLTFADIDCDWCVHTVGEWTDELDEVCRYYIEEQDPTPPTPWFVNRAIRESDITTRSWRLRSELYQFVSRGTGSEDALRLWFAVPGEACMRRIQFCCERIGGLSERDVRVLGLLAPHLVRLYTRAAERRAALPVLGELTPREHEVLRLIASGLTNREIARSLWISPNTVRSHVENIFEKLGVSNRTAAAALARATPSGLESGRNGAPH